MATRLAPRHWQLGGEDRGQPRHGRFGLLLVVLVSSYLMSAFASGPWVSGLQIVLFLGVVGLAARTSQLQRRTIQWLIVAAVAGSAAALGLSISHSEDAWAGVANLWTALILLVAAALIVRRVLAQPTVTLQSIFGAVSAYMILGLMFAALYAAMYRFAGGHFFAQGSPDNIKTFQYFSFTTLTTLGYGDFTAASSGGRAVAVMEALLGQVFLATLVARLVSAFRGPNRAHAQGRRPVRPRRNRPPRPRAAPGISPRGRASPARRSPPRARR